MSHFRRSQVGPALSAIVVLTLSPAAANATSDDEQAAASSSLEFNEKDGSLNMEWSGNVPAGVSVNWLKRIMPIIKRADLWESGGDLISTKTGIVTSPLEKWTERLVPLQHLDKST
jgi:hypothetical protein